MDSKVEQQSISKERLGNCEVCNFNVAKYTCPKCEVKTCQLECLRLHKTELNCDGVRDKTKYIPMRQITEADLMNDYIFLESCTNYTFARRSDKIKRYTSWNRSLPVPLMKLKKAAANSERQIKLNFLLPNFDKHKSNKTHYDWASKVIYWCIEWRFINADNRIIIDERCCESKLMTELIGKYVDCNSSISSLSCYRTKGLSNIALLLKAEAIRKSQNRFFVMDLNKSLQENLQGRSIVEYPVIYVIFNTDIHNYEIINNDEENVIEETRKHRNHYFPKTKDHQTTQIAKYKNNVNKDVDDTTYNSHKPVNYLFSNENEIDSENEAENGQ